MGRALTILTAGVGLLLPGARPATAAATAGPQTAHVYTITSTADGTGSCSPTTYACPTLRAAIIAANANPGSTIRLEHGATYNLTIPASGSDGASTGDLNLTTDTTIGYGNIICFPPANCVATIQGGPGWQDRILTVAAGAAAY